MIHKMATPRAFGVRLLQFNAIVKVNRALPALVVGCRVDMVRGVINLVGKGHQVVLAGVDCELEVVGDLDVYELGKEYSERDSG